MRLNVSRLLGLGLAVGLQITGSKELRCSLAAVLGGWTLSVLNVHAQPWNDRLAEHMGTDLLHARLLDVA